MPKKLLKSFGLVLDFLDNVINGVDFHFVLFFDVFHDIGLNVNAVDFLLDSILINSEGSQLIKVETEQRVSKVGKAFHDFFKVHFEQLSLKIF